MASRDPLRDVAQLRRTVNKRGPILTIQFNRAAPALVRRLVFKFVTDLTTRREVIGDYIFFNCFRFFGLLIFVDLIVVLLFERVHELCYPSIIGIFVLLLKRL